MSPWANPALLAVHGLGMALLVGLTTMVSLRVLGFPKEVPLASYRKVAWVVAGAFIVNAASGVLLFVTDASTLVVNPAFQMKLAAIVIGLLILWGLWRGPVRGAVRWAQLAPGEPFQPSARAKALAVSAIVMWMGTVIVSGRLIAYLKKI